MRSRVLSFEASGIDHMGLIQICFSAEATVSCVCEKQSTCFASNWNWILSRRVYISVPPRFNKHIWALLPENLTRAYIDIVFQYLSRSQIIFALARWRKWLNGLNSKNKKFIWYSAVLLHCVGIETLLLKVRCRSVRRTWELSILVPREITRRRIHLHQHHS